MSGSPPGAAYKRPRAPPEHLSGARSEQNRISWLRPPLNMPKRVPKRAPRSTSGRLQTLQIASNVPSRSMLALGNVEKLIFEGCTVRNHRFGQCQGPPRTHKKRSQRLPEPFCGCLGDDQKWTPKLDQVQNRFLRWKLAGRSQLSGPGTWKLDPKYI